MNFKLINSINDLINLSYYYYHNIIINNNLIRQDSSFYMIRLNLNFYHHEMDHDDYIYHIEIFMDFSKMNYHLHPFFSSNL